MPRCVRCVLPDTFPGVTLDKNGLCNHCRQYEGRRARLEGQRREMAARFDALAEEVRGRGAYDCLMAWSGGKDSTYTLLALRQRYGLNVLAFTFDNGFISPAALRNIAQLSGELGVDHVMVRPRFDLLRSVFGAAATRADFYPETALTRASGICTACMSLAKGIALRMALEKDIPMIAYGWSPGQSPLTSALYRRTPAMARAMTAALAEPLAAVGGESARAYFPTEAQLADGVALPIDVSPLAFWDYDEEHILAEIRALGWQRPADTDPNSTNCLLNALANSVHRTLKGYNPYVLELANLVREGYLDREEALARLDEPEPEAAVAEVRRQLGL
jgi:tRNA(Ile)-lysidine synthase TilS/MesJ